ncbi:MAG: glutamate racemase [Deltaproteobacteria bacterium]|nr:glutamate racemase [Deltaproteobacteria bacterium]
MRDAIGIFDSGIGGLTVLRALSEALPYEDTIYLGDTARVPYGTRSAETVVRYAAQAAKFMAEKRVKLLVVACNTASAVALEAIRETCPSTHFPVVGVIDPGVREALRVSRTRRVGVIGTEATIRSDAYVRALKADDPAVQVFTKACPLFVPLAEEGWQESDVAALTAERYLAGFRDLGVDTLVLGCTHYPVLASVIQKTVGPEITLIDSASATASAVRDTLKDRALDRPAPAAGTRAASQRFYVTDAHERFVKVGSRFLGRDLAGVITVEL